MKTRFLFFLCVFTVLTPFALSAQSQEHVHPIEQSEPLGIDEKLGEWVPLDLAFRDEAGEIVRLRELIHGPTILSLVYYTCPNVCPRIMSSTAQVLGKLQMAPGEEFSVLTVSFDDKDSPSVARQRKANYLKAVGKPFPEGSWRFLTGDQDAIRALTESVGFRFQRRGDAFEHPAALIVLAPDGKVIRYLYGLSYLPFDVKMALSEASEGRPGPTIGRFLLFCFSYDPEGRTYVFNILKVAGIVILFLAMVLAVFLLGKKKMETGE